jgi:hypothetical protein
MRRPIFRGKPVIYVGIGSCGKYQRAEGAGNGHARRQVA